jgi:hypothetical protein
MGPFPQSFRNLYILKKLFPKTHLQAQMNKLKAKTSLPMTELVERSNPVYREITAHTTWHCQGKDKFSLRIKLYSNSFFFYIPLYIFSFPAFFTLIHGKISMNQTTTIELKITTVNSCLWDKCSILFIRIY